MQTSQGRSINTGLVRPQTVGLELEHLVEDRAQLFYDDFTEYDVTDVTKSVLSFGFLDRINVDIFQKYLPHVDRSGGLTEKMGLRHRRLNVPGVVGSCSSLASSNSFAGSSAVSVASTPRQGFPCSQDAATLPVTTTVEECDAEASSSSAATPIAPAVAVATSTNVVATPDVSVLEDALGKTTFSPRPKSKPNVVLAKVIGAPIPQARKILQAHHRRRFHELHMDRCRNVEPRRNARPKTTGSTNDRANGKPVQPVTTSQTSTCPPANHPTELLSNEPEHNSSPLRSRVEDVQMGKNRLVVQSPGQPGIGAHMTGLSVTLRCETTSEVRKPTGAESDSADGGLPTKLHIPVFSQTNHTCPICGTHEIQNAIILRCGHQFCKRHLEAVRSRVRRNLCEEMANPVRFNVVCPLCGDSFCYQGDALLEHQHANAVSAAHFLPVHSRDVATYLGPLKMDWQSSI